MSSVMRGREEVFSLQDADELGSECDKNAATRAFYLLNLILFRMDEHRFAAAFAAAVNTECRRHYRH